MITPIINWILANLPWLAPTIVLVGVTAYVVRHISRWVDKLDNAVSKINTLPCENHLRIINEHKGELDRHFVRSDDSIDEHTRRLSAIDAKLERWDEKMMEIALSNAFGSKKKSPYTLTPFGEFVLVKSFGKDCVDTNMEYFFNAINAEPHTTPYDVERAALGAVMDSFRTDLTNSVKNFLYNAPDEIEFEGDRYRLNTTEVQVAMALYLRDLYIEQSSKDSRLSAPPIPHPVR